MEDGKVMVELRKGIMGAQGPNPIAQLQAMFKDWQTRRNPIPQLQAKLKDLETGYNAWLERQSLPLQTAAVTATSAAQGAAIGGFMGSLMGDISSVFPTPPSADLNPKAMASLQQAQVYVLSNSFFMLQKYPITCYKNY